MGQYKHWQILDVCRWILLYRVCVTKYFYYDVWEDSDVDLYQYCDETCGTLGFQMPYLLVFPLVSSDEIASMIVELLSSHS